MSVDASDVQSDDKNIKEACSKDGQSSLTEAGNSQDEVSAKNKELEIKEKIASDLQEFCKWLKSSGSKDEFELKLKATSTGLFIDESYFYDFIVKYQEWIQKERSDVTLPSKEKIIQKLFSTDNPTLYYIIIGKQAISGFLIEVPLKAPQKMGLGLYKGSPLQAYNYLHPKDRKLENLTNVKLEQGSFGMRFNITSGKYSYHLNFDQLLSFAKVLRSSKKTVEKNPKITTSLFSVVEALPDILSKFKKQKNKYNLLIPGSFRNEKKLMFLRLAELVLILKDSQILEMYELKGKNRSELVLDEIKHNNVERSLRKFNLRVYKTPGRNLFSFDLDNNTYKVSRGVFYDFLDILSRIDGTAFKLKNTFTVLDALNVMLNIFKSASIIDNRDISKYLPKHIRAKNVDGKIKSPIVFIFTTIKAKSSFKVIEYIGEYRKRREKQVEIKDVLVNSDQI